MRQDLEEIFNINIPWKRFEGKTFLITGAYGIVNGEVYNVCNTREF